MNVHTNLDLTKAIEMAAAEMPMVYRYYEKSRTSAADGISFRGCLSDDGDIFSKSFENQGGANRTFATGGRCHGWQLEPCPCGLEPLLTFRQKIPTGRPTPRKDVPSAMGVRGFVSLTLKLH